MNSVKGIADTLNIFRKSRYKYIDSREAWVQTKRALTDQDIYRHFIGKGLFSYCLKYFTDIFAIDIDLHDEYFSPEMKEMARLRKYQLITENIGFPSLLFRSSETGGLHLYYCLEYKLFYRAIHAGIMDAIGDRIRGQGIEILPTPYRPLCLPYAKKRGGTILDPETLQPVILTPYADLKEVVHRILTARRVNPQELFNLPAEITNIFLKTKRNREQMININRTLRLEKHLKQILDTFRPGNTNEAIEACAFNCYVNKYTEKQAAAHVYSLFKDLGIPIHHDTKEKSIQSRITAHYSRYRLNRTKPAFKAHNSELNFIEKEVIRHNTDLVLKANNITHKSTRKAVKRFCKELFIWNRYIRGLNEYDRNVLNYHYPYFYVNTKFKQLTPLPKSLLLRWMNRNSYQGIVKAFQTAGIISLEREYYNPYLIKKYTKNIVGFCRYYRVKIQPLVQKSSTHIYTNNIG